MRGWLTSTSVKKLLPYIQIARPDHWFKNVFMLPGIVLVVWYMRETAGGSWGEILAQINWLKVALGIFATCLVASSNYVINEVLDAPYDKLHPEKASRPVPSGQVHIPYAYALWIGLMIVGVGLGLLVNLPFAAMVFFLWIMGCIYNIQPIRAKNRAYWDVLTESINNPIRLALGWYSTGIVQTAEGGFQHPTLSVLIAYWMFGAFLMAVKRFAEYRMINDPTRAGEYRESFKHYNEERLLESLFFYGAAFGMMSGVFIARYRMELVLATPLVALCIAYYMHIGFRENSAVQHPEKLYREKKLMLLVGLSFVICTVLLLVDIPALSAFFEPNVNVK